MKPTKLIGVAASASIILTALLGVAPASAAVVSLPPNANGTDNSGIRIFACEDRVIFNLPVNIQRAGGMPNEGQYWTYTTYVTVGGETQNLESRDAKVQNIQGGITYAPKQPGDEIELEFYSEVSGFNSSTPFTVEATVVDSDAFAGGNGTRSNPYLISNADQLDLVRCHMNRHFKLTKNINLSGRDWMPIGQANQSAGGWWSGNIDGAGFTINNLTIEDANQEYVGLFGFIYHSSIYSLNIKNADVTGDERVGSLFGSSRHGSFSDIQIIDAKVLGRQRVGAFAGHSNYRSVFSRISVKGEVTGRPFVSRHPDIPNYTNNQSMQSVGGTIGYEDGDGAQWEDITSDAKISIKVEPSVIDFYATMLNSWENRPVLRYVGGFVGESGEAAAYRNIKVKSEIAVDLESGVDIGYMGGVFGDAERSFIDNVVADTKIDINGKAEVSETGGFVGDTYHPVISNSSLKSDINIEVAGENSSSAIGGFVGDAYDGGFHDIRSDIKMNITLVEDAEEEFSASLNQVGGFIGDDEENNLTAIISNATVRITEGNGTNNSIGADVDVLKTIVRKIGGFAGERDDYTSYTKVSSNARVVVSTSNGIHIGGFVGSNDDQEGFAIRDVIMSGTVTLNENITDSGAIFGEAASVHLQNVISTIVLRANGATENIGYVYGITAADNPELFNERSHYRNVFFNNQAAGAAQTEGTYFVGRNLTTLTSAKFLKSRGFDLVNTYDHFEGKLPVIKINAPFLAGKAVKTGQSNNDTSISFGLKLSDGSRNFFVNLKNVNARQVASLSVVRNGKTVRTIHTQVTNAVGNWFVNSKFNIKTGDVLRVTIGKKEISRLVVK